MAGATGGNSISAAQDANASNLGFEAKLWAAIVRVLPPYKGRIHDPCCGSASMFVQSEKFIKAHAGIEPLVGRVMANYNESRTLATIRDALLPKLIT
jgi:hypothetical protein